MTQIGPIIEWMLTTGRLGGLQNMVEGLGTRLRDDGVPLMRLRIGMRTAHPLTTALSVLWEADGRPIVPVTVLQGMESRPSYVGSPIERIDLTGAPFRKSLKDPLDPDDHTVLHELKLRGATDYFGLPFQFTEGKTGVLMCVSDGPDGFDDSHIAAFTALATALSPVIEAHRNLHLATTIATSYLGPRTGQRVLDGQITRGDIETLPAAVVFADIRGWTALNATRPAVETLDIANRFFEVMSDAVDAHDGEILKFLGDGVLALFPGDAAGRQAACRQAIAAAQEAQTLARDTQLPVPFGIGIHYGEVLYGNVGARARIDFTVLGQAVNIAGRVESYCGRLNEAVLVSDTVARHADLPMRHVSTEYLKGVDAAVALHAPVNS